MSMLSVNNIHVCYGEIESLHDISFEIAQGEMVGIIGRNGAGKSTILKTIAGLKHTSQGNILFNGQPFEKMSPHNVVRLGIAYVPEGRRVFNQLTVLENLKLGGYIHYRSGKKEQAKNNLNHMLELFPRLAKRTNQTAGTLSGGEQQMLAIARALMSSPKFLLLDEPSMGLAPIMVNDVFDTVKKLHKSGVTILIVEQKAFLTLKMVDRAYVLTNGCITGSGSGLDLCEDENVKIAYLGKKVVS